MAGGERPHLLWLMILLFTLSAFATQPSGSKSNLPDRLSQSRTKSRKQRLGETVRDCEERL